jgi:hypothetical protein
MRSRLGHAGEYWSVKPPGWQDLLKLPLVDACALQWKMTVEAVLQSAKQLPSAQYMEIRYEELVTNPVEAFERVAWKCGLIWPGSLLQKITTGMENRNFKWQTELGETDRYTLNRLLGDFLKQLGYETSQFERSGIQN